MVVRMKGIIFASIVLVSCSHNLPYASVMERHADSEILKSKKELKEFTKVEVYIARYCGCSYYSKDSCGICRELVRYLDALGVKHMVFFVDEPDCEKNGDPVFCRWGALPVIVCTDASGKRYMNVGFNPDEPERVLEHLSPIN